jgi:tRNA(Ile2)-agmatinylcytidine synthase
MPSLLHIGLDDTDSKKGMCTTYVTTVIIDNLKELGFVPAETPKLIRLNPNCPYKTRGNAALSLSLQIEESDLEQIKRLVLGKVAELADLKEVGTDPGVVFLVGKVPESLARFSARTVREMVTMKEALNLAEEIGAEVYRFKYGRGVIGALAAIGNQFDYGFTYELIAYRTRDRWGTKRRIDTESVVEMDRKTHPYTFDNIDYSTGEIRIMPHTPCPVYLGIRGTDQTKVEEGFRMLKLGEQVERFMIFRTNQGTDAHLSNVNISNTKVNTSVRVKGFVKSSPYVIRGGHVLFRLADQTGQVDCAAYEPTRDFRKIVLKLMPGDEVMVYGSVKERRGFPKTINLEKFELLKCAVVFRAVSPRCPKCNKTMKSEGVNKGYQCPRCKFRDRLAKKDVMEVVRGITPGLYTVPPRARRHLSKPAELL